MLRRRHSSEPKNNDTHKIKNSQVLSQYISLTHQNGQGEHKGGQHLTFGSPDPHQWIKKTANYFTDIVTEGLTKIMQLKSIFKVLIVNS